GWPSWPGWPPLLRPVGFLTTGAGAWGGLAEGGSDELEALAPRRCCRSLTRRSSSSTRFRSVSMRASRWAHPGQLASLMPSFYPARHNSENRWAGTFDKGHGAGTGQKYRRTRCGSGPATRWRFRAVQRLSPREPAAERGRAAAEASSVRSRDRRPITSV